MMGQCSRCNDADAVSEYENELFCQPCTYKEEIDFLMSVYGYDYQESKNYVYGLKERLDREEASK